MKHPMGRLNALLLVLLCMTGMNLRATAQVSAVATDARPGPTVLLEARVVGIPSSEFREHGVIFPESADILDGPLGFAVVLPENEAQTLAKHPRTTSVHNLKLQGNPGSPLKFRVDSRVPVNGVSTAANPAYFDVGMTFEVTPRIFAGRRVALSTSSLVQVRRGDELGGSLAPVVFETLPIKHNIEIPEGKTILLGGFLTALNSEGLPAIPAVSGNPVLGYVASKSPRKGNEPEIVVLLTPRILGTVEETALPPVLTAVPQPVEPTAKSAFPPVVPASIPVPKPDVTVPPPASLPPATVMRVDPVAPPSAPVPTRSAPAVPKREARFYTVQVGAFGTTTNAEALADELKKKFQGVFIDEAVDVRTPFRVRVGRVSTLTAAKRIQSQLKAQGFDSYIVTPDMP